MDVLVCVKRVAAPGPRIPLTDDGLAVDTTHLGFTIGPHDECAVEEAVRLVEADGGRATVLTVGPPDADEQLRYAMSMGADDGVLVETAGGAWDPQATAAAITDTVGALQAERGAYDLVLFGNEAPDAGNYQVGIRVAHALGLPIVAGVKGLTVTGDTVTLEREIPDGVERYELALPAAAAVREGLNLPRYPTVTGRLRAKRAEVVRRPADPEPGGLSTLGLHHPPRDDSETVVLGTSADAAGPVADLLDDLGLL